MPNWRYVFEEELKDTVFSEQVQDGQKSNFSAVFGSVFDELNNQMLKHELSDDPGDQQKYKDYEDILVDWQGYVKRLQKRGTALFGRPINLAKRSFLVDFFRMVESFESMSNNFGDVLNISDIETPQEREEQTGNHYAMDSKSLEWDIVRMVAHNLGLPVKPRLVVIKLNPSLYATGYWGYVTSGSVESAVWGAWQGFEHFPTGHLYLSEASDYAVFKSIKHYPHTVAAQTSADDESVYVQTLISNIETNWHANQTPAILILNHGTQKQGSIDDIASIKAQLVSKGIPHYIHVDASLYGGIPSNQTGAPLLGEPSTLGYDSIGISLHKYIGYPMAKGVVISVEPPKGQFIDFIGQRDSTLTGSRNLPAFSLRQQVTEVLLHSQPGAYIANVTQFAHLLGQAGISYHNWQHHDKRSNVFVFKVNPDKVDYKVICKRWQLSEFVGKDGAYRVLVVIFPYHDLESMTQVVSDLRTII